jgi:hypothetical protein
MRRREKIVTLAEARAAGLKRYFTGKPCSRGHVVERQVSNQGCLQCLRLAKRRHRRSPAASELPSVR